MRLAPILCLLAQSALAQDSVIEGQLRDAVSGTPIADAKVTLQSVKAPGTPAALLSRISDPAGTFRFEGLAAGAYELSFRKVGYVDSGYLGGPTLQLRVKPGAEPAHCAVDLVPTGSIEGQVLDEEGKPVKGVLLYAERPNAPAILAIAEDGGRFRLDYLPPAQFRIEARVPYPLRKETARRNPDSGQVEGYPNTQFYPGVEDVRAAALVPVAAGSHQSGFNIRLARTPLVDLSGSAVDAGTREAAAGAEVELAPLGGGLADSTYERRAVAADGSFRFDLIRPGRYALYFYRRKGEQESPHVATVEVGRSGLQDYVEKIPTLTRLAGTVVMPPGKAIEWGPVKVVLTSAAGGGHSREVETADDGTFAFDRVAPGRWALAVLPARGWTRAWYVAGIRIGRQQSVDGRFSVAEGVNPPLEVELGGDAAQVAGTVVDAKGLAVARAMVVARGANGGAAFQSVSADGAFTIPGLAPGEYTVTAVPSAEAPEWMGGARECGAKSARVTMGSSERRVVQLELCTP